jgi:Transposase DDE domain group 1
VDQFIASFKTAPEELVLDFDATDNPLYGQQEGRFLHDYYDSFCYLPLYVFCGQQLLCVYLRPRCASCFGVIRAFAVNASSTSASGPG